MSQPLKPETLTEIRTYFGGYRKRGEHCSSPKCQPYAHALLAELFRLQDENARLREALRNLLDQTPCGPNYSTREQARAAARAALAGEVPNAD